MVEIITEWETRRKQNKRRFNFRFLDSSKHISTKENYILPKEVNNGNGNNGK